MGMVLICFCIVVFSIIITHLLNRIFKSKRYVKYIPAGIMLFFTVYYIIIAKTMVYTGLEDLANIVMGMLLFVGGISSLLYAVIIEIVTKRGAKRDMKKWILLLIFIPLNLLITFFGLGPVLLADGTIQERIYTLLIVVGLYAIITIIFRKLVKKAHR